MSLLPPPALRHITDLTVTLDPIRHMNQGRAGFRRIIPIVGGTAAGPMIKGKILNVGADWQTQFASGLTELDTRYAIETDDGAIIEIKNYGYRHGPAEVLDALVRGEEVPPDAYYMRTHARLESGDERYAWVNHTLFPGHGARMNGLVQMLLFAID
jgi:hypothetical protein